MGVSQQKPYGPLRLAFKYLSYLINSSNGKGHGIHSPFIYEMVRNVLMDKREETVFAIPESYRKQMLQDDLLIPINDHGAGSVDGFVATRKLKDIAKRSLKSKKYARLLYKLTAFYKWENVIELGTSLGVTTGYLSLAGTVKNVYTIEGGPEIAQKASAFFDKAGLSNIKPYIGTFDQVLPVILKMVEKVDMVFIDGNHRKAPTLQYWNMILPFLQEDSCIILDDIHWSKEMEETWEVIKNQPSVTCTIDLFFIGIVFFRKAFKEPQHLQIRY
ncbi:MAG: O-methyltransferase [Chitinophagaceae bacterium]